MKRITAFDAVILASSKRRISLVEAPAVVLVVHFHSKGAESLLRVVSCVKIAASLRMETSRKQLVHLSPGMRRDMSQSTYALTAPPRLACLRQLSKTKHKQTNLREGKGRACGTRTQTLTHTCKLTNLCFVGGVNGAGQRASQRGIRVAPRLQSHPLPGAVVELHLGRRMDRIEKETCTQEAYELNTLRIQKQRTSSSTKS